ncbi:hypothetical protein [Streptomyces sp. AN091965]|uniref:hypothetical protein n=1 Tax=Streptomyces sp. AN091965 TaxID=2927803 RepID=UPI001F61F93F|nr:hypothetical protein [Streptomyces sp. AN091965]MCI3928052.1 hypothetical protein [Streptomyces sp. AN091965]
MDKQNPGVACERLRPEPTSPETCAADGRLAALVRGIAEVLSQRGYHVGQAITCTVEDGFFPQVVVKVDASTYLNISWHEPALSCTWRATRLVAGRQEMVEELNLNGCEFTAEEIVEASLSALALPSRQRWRA